MTQQATSVFDQIKEAIQELTPVAVDLKNAFDPEEVTTERSASSPSAPNATTYAAAQLPVKPILIGIGVIGAALIIRKAIS